MILLYQFTSAKHMYMYKLDAANETHTIIVNEVMTNFFLSGHIDFWPHNQSLQDSTIFMITLHHGLTAVLFSELPPLYL